MQGTEQEIYDESIGEQTENAPETPVQAPVEAVSERVRDEKGRYVSATPEPTSQEAPVVQEAAPQPEAEPHQDARVPSWRLAEEAERRRSAEQALNELRNEIRMMQMQRPQMPQEPQPEAPDIFADPQGFVQQLQNNFQQQLATMRLEGSLKDAHRTHGDKFNEAYKAFTEHVSQNRDQATYQRVMASHDPGENLVQWFNEQQLHRELGGSDLNTFLSKRQEEWLKDPAVQAKVIEAFKATQQAQAPSNNLTSLPPSLNKASAARSAHDDSGSSGADMYAYATRK